MISAYCICKQLFFLVAQIVTIIRRRWSPHSQPPTWPTGGPNTNLIAWRLPSSYAHSCGEKTLREPAQLTTKFIAKWKQHKARFVRRRWKRKKEMPTWKGQCCPLIPFEMSQITPKRKKRKLVACLVTLLFSPSFSSAYCMHGWCAREAVWSLSLRSLVRACVFWLSGLKVETRSWEESVLCLHLTSPFSEIVIPFVFWLEGDFHCNVRFVFGFCLQVLTVRTSSHLTVIWTFLVHARYETVHMVAVSGELYSLWHRL